jgi:protein-tyrosine-phosphatase
VGDLNFLVDSAGTHAIPGQEWCSASVSAGASRETVTQVAKHIDKVDLDSYDLILASGRSQRAAVLQYQPKIRAKLYPLREAVLQISWITQPGGVLDAVSGGISSKEYDFDVDRIPKLPETMPSRWNWLINEMNEWRGFVEPVSNGSDSLDILDPHESNKDIHLETFAQIDEAVAGLTLGISTVLYR